MESKISYNLLGIILVATGFCVHATGETKSNNKAESKNAEAAITTKAGSKADSVKSVMLPLVVSIQERNSKIELAKQTIKLDLTSKTPTILFGDVKALKDIKISLLGREVKINSVPGFQWFEMAVTDAKGKSIGYGSATLPESQFSFGVGFVNPNTPHDEWVVRIDPGKD